MSRSLLLPLLVLVACKGEEPIPWEWIDVTVTADPAFDPKLDGGGLAVTLSTDSALSAECTTTVAAIHSNGVTTPLGQVDLRSGPVELTWDGVDADGFVVDPGEVQIAADVQCTDRMQGYGEARTYVVRLGASQIDFGIDGENAQQTLAWHKASLLERDYRILARAQPEYKQLRPDGELADLDLDDGSPRPAPEPWTRADVPPWGSGSPDDITNWVVPVGYVANSSFSVGFVPGTHGVSVRTGVAVPADGPLAGSDGLPVIRVVSDELQSVDEGAWAPGRAVHFEGASTPDTLGLHTVSFTWRFEALRDGVWVPLAGELTTEHPMWVLAGVSAVKDGTENGAAPGRISWIGVLHDTVDAVQGLPADDTTQAMTALRQALHEDPYILYNPNDSAYSTFSGRYIYWNRIWLDMSD